MTRWNLADIWETVADVQPGAVAIIQGERRVTWGEFDHRADGVARWLLGRGVEQQDKVAIYLTNCPEYLETVSAATKVGLVPVNTNYRYTKRELAYLWDDSDTVVVVFHGSFVDRISEIKDEVPRIHSWLWVDDGSGPCPDWAVSYEDVVSVAGDRPDAPWGRGPDDLILLYTGGTTGMPKGVMWRQDDLFALLNKSGLRRFPPEGDVDDVRKELLANGPGMTLMPACPLMHGTGCFTSWETLGEGGTVVLLTTRHYDPEEMLDAVEREKVNVLVIVGDPFARPMLGALDAEPDRWDLSSMVGIISSGAMWSEEVKRGLLRHHPGLLLVDAFSSSEAIGVGVSVSTTDQTQHTAQFTLGPNVRVISTTGDYEIEPGSEEVGVLALGGRNPLGYYKDPDKSAATFRVIDGVRYSIPGDFAQVTEDGGIRLLGRGSVSINSAGEKVYPEEVEEALKTHAAVRDAVVVGVPNEQFGEEVVAVVEVPEGADFDEAELIAHVKGQLAGYKAPQRVRAVPSIGRSPSGKVDYRRQRDETIAWMAAQG